VFLFQVPVIPEMIWKAGLDRLWPGYLKHHEQVADARFSASQKSDGLYGVKLYRANFLTRLLRPRTRVARCPVQVIIPTRDAYVRPQLNEHLVRWTGKLTLQTLDTTHWAPLTEPEAVSRAVRTFVAAHP
jgi:pimeloyl-ACP methyl ester carboxylesterase